MPRRKLAAWSLSVCGLAATAWGVYQDGQDGSDGASVQHNMEQARAALDHWFEASRTVSRERADWELKRELLNEQVSVLEREIESVRAKTAEARENITRADRDREELQAKGDALEKGTQALTSTVEALELKSRALLAGLPEPLLERVRPIAQGIPAPDAASKPGLPTRFLNVVGVLNEVDKFQREVTTASEVRTLPDGRTVEVTSLYLGLGQAYYVGANGSVAGVGLPGEHGWEWQPMDAAAEAISRAIAMAKNEVVAAFVRLPVTVR